MTPLHVELPALRGLLGNGLRQLTETTFGPTALFALLLHTSGLQAAIGGALALNYTLIARRLLTGSRLPVLLVVGTTLLTARSIAAIVLQSAFLYFAQSSVNALLVAVLFAVSAAGSRPLAARLVRDFVPLPSSLLRAAPVHRFFRQVSAAWALLNVVNAVMTLMLLRYASLDALLLFRGTLSPLLTAAALVSVGLCGRTLLRRECVTLGMRWKDPAVSISAGAEPLAVAA